MLPARTLPQYSDISPTGQSRRHQNLRQKTATSSMGTEAIDASDTERKAIVEPTAT